MAHPYYYGAAYCHACTAYPGGPETMQAVFRGCGDRLLCRAHWQQETKLALPDFRTAEDLDDEEAGCR